MRVFCPRVVPDAHLVRIPGGWGSLTGTEQPGYYAISFDTAPGYYRPPEESVIHWIVGGGRPSVVEKWVLTDFAHEVPGDARLVRTMHAGGRKLLIYRSRLSRRAGTTEATRPRS